MGAADELVERFVGVLEKRGRFIVAEPLFQRGRRVTMDGRARSTAALGEMALVQVGRGGRARVLSDLGRPDVARNVMNAMLVDRGHARKFAPKVEEESRESAKATDAHARRDLTALPTFTIDPPTALDYDDAISVERVEDSFELRVHIADVAAHVPPGSATDGQAAERGNSVYVPGTVEPMLPESLSNEACSLIPGVPRQAVTVEMAVAGDGAVRSTSFCRSVIRSDARLNYDEVDEFFEGKAKPPLVIAASLEHARTLAAAVRRRRLARGALAIETSEPAFEFDSHGHVVRAEDAVQTESHELIEEFMILANEQVAETLSRRRRPALYRVHEQPDPQAIQRLVAQLESLDVPTPALPDQIPPGAAGELIAAIGAAVTSHVQQTGRGRTALSSLVLRSMKQAYYSPTNLGHAGLASSAYLHFTSPIRRYPDLVVHRSLLAAVGEGEGAPASVELGETARHCSQTEREAMDLERSADDVCLAFLLERALAEEGWDRSFEGEVTGLAGAGAFVGFATERTGAALSEGFLPARLLRGEYFELNEEGTALVGRRTGRTLRLGDPITVSVKSVDPPRGRVDLVA